MVILYDTPIRQNHPHTTFVTLRTFIKIGILSLFFKFITFYIQQKLSKKAKMFLVNKNEVLFY